MGKNQSASNLTNIIQYNNGNISFVSGSTTLMQISSSGAITTTGVISGSNALSASYAATSTSASYAANSTSASYAASATNAASATSASYAITSSYADVFTVASTLTAQTLVVQTITSSVDFVTGSTRFGSVVGNTHVFTGSVTMNPEGLFVSSSGLVGIGTTTPSYNLDVRGNASFGDSKFYNSVQLTTAAYGGNTDGWIWAGATGTLNFGTGSVSNTNKIMSLLPGGVVGIGMTSGFGRVKIIAETSTGYQGLNVFNSGTGTYSMGITHDGTTGVIATDYIGGSGAAYTPITFLTDNAERMRIMNSTGYVGIGLGGTNPSYHLHVKSTISGYTAGIINTYAGDNAGLLIKAGVNAGNEILNCQAGNGNNIFKVDVSGEITSTNGEMYFKRTAFSPYGHIYMGSDQNFYLRNTGAGNVDIYTNGSSRLKVTSTGYIVTPTNPAFSMYINANVTGPSVVAFGGTIFNDGNHFNTSTYQFTAPVAGRYFFSFYDNMFPNNSNPCQMYFRVNGTRRGAVAYTLNKGASWYLMSFQQVLKLSAGDVVDVYNESGDRPDFGSADWGNFSGAYLG